MFFDLRASARPWPSLAAALLLCGAPLGAAAQHPPPTLADDTPFDWREANDTVGRFLRGHIDILKAEPAPTARPVTATPLLDLAQAQQIALSRQPALFLSPGMSGAQRLAAQRDTLALRQQVAQAWADAVVSAQLAQLGAETLAAAQAGAELGRRMVQVGSWSRAQWQREQVNALQAQLDLDRTQQAAHAAREQLVRLLALQDPTLSFSLPAALPQAVGTPSNTPVASLEDQALGQHMAVIAARQHAQRATAAVDRTSLEALRRQVLAAATQAAGSNATAVLDTNQPPWSHELEQALAAEREAQRLEAQLRSQVREAWQQLRSSEARVGTQTQLLRLHTELQADMQRRYNGMLKSTWDLLASARERLAAQQALLQAQHSAWLAQLTLNTLLAGGEYRPAGDATPSSSRATGATAQGH